MRSRKLVPLAGLAALGLLSLLVSGFRLGQALPSRAGEPQRVATFAGGCFWSMQKAFDGVAGVVRVTAGYAGGTQANPNYEEVETGKTGYAESVDVIYDPARISYDGLLDIYWHHIDPLTPNRAFCDRGPQYRSIIFYRDAEQQRAAEASKRALDQSHRFSSPIVTAIQPATKFYPAEEYHQYFYKKNPVRYAAYNLGCGREARLKELWGETKQASVTSRQSPDGTGR